LSWKEQIVIEEYYGTFDIISEIGGIRGSVSMTIKFTGFIFIIHYVWTLAKLISRKQANKVRKQKIKNYLRKLHLVQAEISSRTQKLYGREPARKSEKAVTRKMT
jgi:hypothetical protein